MARLGAIPTYSPASRQALTSEGDMNSAISALEARRSERGLVLPSLTASHALRLSSRITSWNSCLSPPSIPSFIRSLSEAAKTPNLSKFRSIGPRFTIILPTRRIIVSRISSTAMKAAGRQTLRLALSSKVLSRMQREALSQASNSYERTSLHKEHIFSELIGFLLNGMADDPTCFSEKNSFTSPTDEP